MPFEPYVGGIYMFAGNFAPQGYAFCNGDLLPISQYSALFSLLGTTYGGDGNTTFALPDLRGRFVLGAGQNPGGASFSLGETGGEEADTLTIDETPSHIHALQAQSGEGDANAPAGTVLAATKEPVSGYSNAANAAPNSTMSATTIAAAGAGQSHNNMPPFQTVNFIIALQGFFPQHS